MEREEKRRELLGNFRELRGVLVDFQIQQRLGPDTKLRDVKSSLRKNFADEKARQVLRVLQSLESAGALDESFDDTSINGVLVGLDSHIHDLVKELE